jgi:Fur family ferric uptake transcriptional regulator
MNTLLDKPKRMTRQRKVVLEELRQVCSHPTADELFQRVRCRLPRISLATVYRNLDVLAREGVVRRLDSGGGAARFDGDLEPHYHVRCEGCGLLEDVPPSAIAPLDLPAETAGGFRLTGMHLELVGQCPACQQAAQQNAE